MGCDITVVAKSNLGCVTLCECGAVTVHCGNASMRIRKDEFMTFARMMDEAFANLASRELGKPNDGNDNMSKLYPGMGPFCG